MHDDLPAAPAGAPVLFALPLGILLVLLAIKLLAPQTYWGMVQEDALLE